MPKRPENAEEILKKIDEALPEIEEKHGEDARPIIGFLDESSLRSDPSRRN